MYVLDEPSIGLHQRDNDRLIASLKKMRDLGNTLIVVEHDEDTMRAADYLIDVGPGLANTVAVSWHPVPLNKLHVCANQSLANIYQGASLFRYH